jgi:hypothetical protein
MKDPAFLEFTRKRQMPVEPMTGDQLLRLVEEGINVPAAVVERTAKLVGPL